MCKLHAHVQESGSVVGLPGAEPISSEDLIEQACDVLVPAAVGSQIHEGNAGRVKAAVIIEGANGPITREHSPSRIRSRCARVACDAERETQRP